MRCAALSCHVRRESMPAARCKGYVVCIREWKVGCLWQAAVAAAGRAFFCSFLLSTRLRSPRLCQGREAVQAEGRQAPSPSLLLPGGRWCVAGACGAGASLPCKKKSECSVEMQIVYSMVRVHASLISACNSCMRLLLPSRLIAQNARQHVRMRMAGAERCRWYRCQVAREFRPFR